MPPERLCHLIGVSRAGVLSMPPSSGGISTATSTCKTRSRRLRWRAEVQVTMCEEGTAVGDGRSTTSTFGESNHARDNRWFASATVNDDDRF